MKLYNYDDNGIYYSTTKAKPDPLEIGKWLIPRNATVIALPVVGEHEAARFDGQAWEIVPNWLGTVHYIYPDRTPLYVSAIGDDLPDGAVLEQWEPTAEELAEAEEEALEVARLAGVDQAQEAAGLKKYTVEQAEAWIDGQLDLTEIEAAATDAERWGALRKLLINIKKIELKQVLYLLK